MCRPSNQEQGQLHGRIVASASRQDLDEVALYHMGINLDTIAGNGQTLRKVVFEFLKWVDQHGRWVDFLNALSRRMSHDRQLVSLCARLLGQAGAAAPTAVTWTIPLAITIQVGQGRPAQP
jgi:hypothetical protein